MGCARPENAWCITSLEKVSFEFRVRGFDLSEILHVAESMEPSVFLRRQGCFLLLFNLPSSPPGVGPALAVFLFESLVPHHQL